MFKYMGNKGGKYMIYDTEDYSADYCSKSEIDNYIRELELSIRGIKSENNRLCFRKPTGTIYLVRLNIISKSEINIYRSTLNNSYWGSDDVFKGGNIYEIYVDSEFLGLLDLNIRANSSSRWGYINMIEIIRKGEGYGKKVIKEIFKAFNLSSVTGESISTAIPFWESVGADFHWESDEDYEDALDSSDVFYFQISR